jgi:hypothetical protein
MSPTWGGESWTGATKIAKAGLVVWQVQPGPLKLAGWSKWSRTLNSKMRAGPRRPKTEGQVQLNSCTETGWNAEVGFEAGRVQVGLHNWAGPSSRLRKLDAPELELESLLSRRRPAEAGRGQVGLRELNSKLGGCESSDPKN